MSRHPGAASGPVGQDTPDGWLTAARQWLPQAYLAVAAALVPWTVYLAVSLPRRSVSEHYRGTWVGFDIVLILVLARIGWFAHRRSYRIVLTAAAGATLLVTDAWFDVTTASGGSAHTQAVIAAVLLELPGAASCGLIARRGLEVLTTAASAVAPTPTAHAPNPLRHTTPSPDRGGDHGQVR